MLRSLHWGLLSIALVAGVGCSSGEAGQAGDTLSEQDPIVGGSADRGKDPAVVAIDIGGQGLCTGTLISPRWVLTARHCVSETAEEVECPSRAPQVHGTHSADSFTILVGDDAQTARPVAIGQRVVVPSSDQLCDHDLALIELDRAVTSVTPLALASLSGVKTVRGVGFGRRGDNAAAGKKMTRSNVPILDESAAEFEVGVLSCSGDSGGPALDSKGRVVGVVSRGGPDCSGPQSRNIYTRVDAFHELIDQALGKGEASTGTGTGTGAGTAAQCGAGKRCANGTHCNSSTLRCEASS
ncbi:MAG: trypsin-like serine protease [Pseudomonadota bacterium]